MGYKKLFIFHSGEDGHDHRKPWQWKPTSAKLLDLAEAKMLQGIFSAGMCIMCRIMFALHCVKIVRIQSFSGPYFPSVGLNTEIYSLHLRIQSERGKIQTRKTLNTDTFTQGCFYHK